MHALWSAELGNTQKNAKAGPIHRAVVGVDAPHSSRAHHLPRLPNVFHPPLNPSSTGWEKSRFCWYKLLMLSLLAGAYVGLGYTTALQAAGLMDQAPSNPDASAVSPVAPLLSHSLHSAAHFGAVSYTSVHCIKGLQVRGEHLAPCRAEQPITAGGAHHCHAIQTALQVNRGVFNLVMGAFGSPFVFTMIVICGAELFSSMCVYTAAAWWEGKVRVANKCSLHVIISLLDEPGGKAGYSPLIPATISEDAISQCCHFWAL